MAGIPWPPIPKNLVISAGPKNRPRPIGRVGYSHRLARSGAGNHEFTCGGRRKDAIMNNQTTFPSTGTSYREQVGRSVLEEWVNGQIYDPATNFADEFRYSDYGIGLEFRDRKSISELSGSACL
jgi:hypothetical protein